MAEEPPANDERRIEELIAALDNLWEGERAVVALIAYGPGAVAPLRRFLIGGRPATVYQPRRWAVEALGGLGAREVLEEYLLLPPVADPEVRLAEEAVQNAAVREFLRWPDQRTIDFLLDLSRKKMLVGLVEVLGRLSVLEAIPYFDRALEDDVCRAAAEEALTGVCDAAREHLLLSATFRLPVGRPESPSSLRRRQSALKILAAEGVYKEEWPQLRELVHEEDPEIAVRACGLAARAGIREAAGEAVPRLVELAGVAPWFLQDEIIDCLLAWWDEARPVVEAEVARRMAAPEAERVRDRALRLFLRAIRLAPNREVKNGE